MKRSSKFLSILGMAAALSLMFAVPTHIQAREPDTIEDGVYIGTIDVGGMTEEEARAAVASYVEKAGAAELTLTAGEKNITVAASGLGIHFSDMSVVQEALDVGKRGSILKRYKDKKELQRGDKVIDMRLGVDDAEVTALLEEKADKLNQKAVNNGLIREGEEFRFVAGAQGIAVNIPDSIEILKSYLGTEWDGGDADVALAAEIVEPRGSREELSQIKDILGSYKTDYKSSNSNRCKNIEVAAGKINGTVLYPGEEFTVAGTIGPMDAANGYELAGSYENGQTVQSYGGGVCQVSTTLYNALILAELEITERFNHSMIVNYVKPSMDAAIAGDYKDLCFVNNYDAPIYIEGYTVGKSVHFNIYGRETRPSNRVVTYESEVVSQEDPVTQFVGTGDPAGYIAVAQSKHIGYAARVWKIVTVDGVEQSREVYNKSTYKASPKIVNVGTASPDPNVSAIIGAALATGDEAAVYAAVAPYAANAAAILNPAPPVSPDEQAIAGTVDASQITGGQ